MSPPNDAARKLNRMLWRERWRKIGIGAAVAAAIVGAFVVTDRYRTARSDPTLSSQNVHAKVTGFGNGNASRGAYIVHAHLDDGRDVDAFATIKIPPTKGASVVLNEARHQSGRVTYDLVRVERDGE